MNIIVRILMIFMKNVMPYDMISLDDLINVKRENYVRKLVVKIIVVILVLIVQLIIKNLFLLLIV